MDTGLVRKLGVRKGFFGNLLLGGDLRLRLSLLLLIVDRSALGPISEKQRKSGLVEMILDLRTGAII